MCFGLDAETAWILGAIVGDGSGDGRFTNVDAEILAKLGERFGLTPLKGDPNSYYLRGCRPLLKEFGLTGCNARSKRVPSQVFTAGRAAIAAFLAGYLDTDGCVIVRHLGGRKVQTVAEWASVNRELLEECQHLLTGLGVNASLREARSQYLGAAHVSWKLTVNDSTQLSLLAEVLPLVHKGKRERLDRIAGRPKRCVFAGMDNDRVVQVNRLVDGPSISIEVEDTHTHVTAGLVTHNTELLAWLAFVELHPEAPVRFCGFNRDGSLKPGRPVKDPYIPLMANTQEQVAELAYGALMVVCEEGADPELFDIGLDRILRVDGGWADGKAVPIAGAPNARDGARTTFQGIDEPHRLYLPNHKAAVETMIANLPKRPIEDPWMCSTTTAGQPGQNSVAEDEYFEAEAMARGEVDRPTFFFFHRQASDGYDMSRFEDRVEAIREASGPDVAEWSDLEGIASQWDRPKADKTYLERVWCNRWTQSEAQAFDVRRWNTLGCAGEHLPPRSRVVIGFDGARMRDSTALVVCDVKHGFMELAGLWERPVDAEDGWEVPESEVTDKLTELMRRFNVAKVYCDPPHWNNTVGEWSVKWPDKVEEWWTNRRRQVSQANKAFREAIETGRVSHNGDPDLERHIGNAGRADTNLVDDPETGEKAWILCKLHPDRKLDAAMAAVLAWQARMDVLGSQPKSKRRVVQRIR
ncbi:LAGLIDADG family homing endonuclease (plasmid) [Nocardia sp. CA-151230]|uniref:LAGLIDADG family homing endonuclease n=1 Tax=Nocardia sp. CA-151230 TaxID=3239982 RepID=UPI003D8A5D07